MKDVKIPKKVFIWVSIIPILILCHTFVSRLYIVQFDSYPDFPFKYMWILLVVLYITLTLIYRDVRKKIIPSISVYILTIIFFPLVVMGISAFIIEPAQLVINANVGKQEAVVISGIVNSKWEQKPQSSRGRTRYYINVKNSFDSKSVSLMVPFEIYNKSTQGRESKVDLAKGYLGIVYLKNI